MDEGDKSQPAAGARATQAQAERAAREAAALRENLHRRKAQARSRAADEAPPAPDNGETG